MATIDDEYYYMEMPTDFDYRVMEGIVRACSQAGSEWEGIVYEYNRKEKIIRFQDCMHLHHSLYLNPEKCFRFITEISKKLDSCAESMGGIREQLMNVEFEVTVYREDSHGYAEQYRVERKNGRAMVLNGSGQIPWSYDTLECASFEEFLGDMEDMIVLDDDRPIDVICREIWPEGQDNPCWRTWVFEEDEVYIHGAPEIGWGELGDLYQIELVGREWRGVFDANVMITEAMDESGIPHDEDTLEELSTQDVYDILAGTYDKEKSKARLTADMLKGKNFVLSTFHSSAKKNWVWEAIRFVDGKLQSEIGTDTDFIVYNEKLEDKGDNYRLALELIEQGRDIRLISFTELGNAVWL